MHTPATHHRTNFEIMEQQNAREQARRAARDNARCAADRAAGAAHLLAALQAAGPTSVSEVWAAGEATLGALNQAHHAAVAAVNPAVAADFDSVAYAGQLASTGYQQGR